ncbi:hypothetical protein [Streptomyces sp. NPDC005301]|uniref:hypothetical protein n=1 Tax=unclassified Streptomyces TaxID=2593676 RepID=UPI0033A1386B
MAYHEGSPWREPRTTPPSKGRVLLGCLVALALVVVLAILEIEAAAIIVGLALISGFILVIGTKVSRRRSP